jgi:hypothetical protein
MSQAPFPSPAVALAPSVQAAYASLGATQPIGSGHLLLDLPDVAAPGLVKGLAKSLIPGTTAMYVFRSIATAPKTATKPAAAPRKGAVVMPAAPASPAALTVLIGAQQVRPKDDAAFEFEFEFDTRESFILLAFAQGKWFITGREIKPATLLKSGVSAGQ